MSDNDDAVPLQSVEEDEGERECEDRWSSVSGLHPAVRSFMYTAMGSDSDSPDDSSTVKCGTWSGSNNSDNGHNSSSSLSTSSSGKSARKLRNKPAEDTSTCCDDDFQWIKSETLPEKFEQNNQQRSEMSPAADTDEEECRKIIKSKRSEVSSKLCADKPPVPSGHEKSSTGSLDRRRHHPPNRMDRDQKSKSTHSLKSPHYSPSRQYSSTNSYRSQHSESPGPHNQNTYPVDYAGNHLPNNDASYHYFTPPRHMTDLQRRHVSYEHFNKRHEHNDPQRYGSNSMLMEHRSDPYQYGENPYHGDMRNVPYYYGSRQDLHGSHPELSCYQSCCYHPHGPPLRPPGSWCGCGCADPRSYRIPYGCKNSEGTDDRIRRLEGDKDSLQLQVSVLSEQIAAQTDKISDLERMLGEKRNQLNTAEELLQREILTRSSLETQKLELMSTISDARLRQAALERENQDLRSAARPSPGPMANGGPARRQSQSPSPCPSPASSMLHHTPRESSTPRTPPASYRRLVTDQSPHSYSSLPRGACLTSPSPAQPRTGAPASPLDTAVVVRFGKPNQQHCMVVARGRGHSVPNLAEKDTVIGTGSPVLGKVIGSGGKGWGALFRGGSGGALEDITDGDLKDPFQRGGVRATAAPRLQSTQHINERWSSTPLKEWDSDITCEWLESMALDCYSPEARKWLTNSAGNKGIIATATPQQVEKELNLKNALHRKKITLALLDLQDASSDPLLRAAGRLDASWALRWLEDAGLPQYREAWIAACVDGRVLHRLCHEDLHTLRVTSQLHALSIRRGIQVLRENNFSPDTMIRRAASAETAGETESEEGGHVSRWSSHRVMEWLRAVDLAEYAPNLRGAGVHGGLMYYEVRFTGELLATLLNIPPSKTLLRRHLNTRFNQLIGKEVIQEKREAEQTLGYQPLTLTSKVKVTKKGQFTLKRKKNKGEPEYGDLVCPIVDQASDDEDGGLRRRGGCLSAN